MRIPGIPGSSEPSFRTRDCQWLGLDTMVRETVAELAEQGLTLSPYVVKATVQVGRMAVQGPCGRDVDALVQSVQMHLRDRRVLISADHIQAILTTYTEVICTMDIAEINEFVG